MMLYVPDEHNDIGMGYTRCSANTEEDCNTCMYTDTVAWSRWKIYFTENM